MKDTPVADLLGPGGPISQVLSGFMARPQQIDVSHAIDTAIRNQRHAIIEAPTGTGKGLAYLIPAVKAISEGKVVVVSTHTIGLQSQLMLKDIPQVVKAFPKAGIRPWLMKGRGNFICLQDLAASQQDLFIAADPEFTAVEKWARTTQTGDVADLPFTYSKWAEVRAKAETCRGSECFAYDRCFFFKSRIAAKEANLLVVNHALYMSNLQLVRQGEEGVIPPHDVVIFDEAHTMEGVATECFGISFESSRLPRLVNRLKRLSGFDIDHSKLEAIEFLSDELFACIQHPDNKQDYFLSDVLTGESGDHLFDTVERLDIMLNELETFLDGKTAPAAIAGWIDGAKKTCEATRSDMGVLFDTHDRDGSFIRWASMESAEGPLRITCRYSPVDVAPLLRTCLWSAVPSVICTSATLATNSGFGYLKQRLGVCGQVEERIVDSPFDYKSNCMLYVPSHLPEPPKGNGHGNGVDTYYSMVGDEILRLTGLSDGRAFVLCTSRASLNRIYDYLTSRTSLHILKQGDAPHATLLDRFKSGEGSILLGLATFWEGVDVQGDALSLVIIDRIPFAVPDSPIVRARTDAIERAGGNWFSDYSIPQAQIKLKQGFGRLIRTEKDRGIVAILDTRMLTKRYGQKFLENLPPAKRASWWDRVENWWGAHPSNRVQEALAL